MIAFTLASAVPAVWLAIFALISEFRASTANSENPFLVAAASFLVFFPYSLFFTALLGIPGYLLLRRLGLIRWWTTVGSGAIAGAVVAVLVRPGNLSLWQINFIPAGAIAGLIFWLFLRFVTLKQIPD